MLQDLCGGTDFTVESPRKSFSSSCSYPYPNKDSSCLSRSTGAIIFTRYPSDQINGGQVQVLKVNAIKSKLFSIQKIHDRTKGPGCLPVLGCVPLVKDASSVGLLDETCARPRLGLSESKFCQRRSAIEQHFSKTDVERPLFFSDADLQCKDQVTRCFLQAFHSVEEVDDQLFAFWWGQVNKGQYNGSENFPFDNHGITEVSPDISHKSTHTLVSDVEDKPSVGSFDSVGLCSSAESKDSGESFLDEDGISVSRLQSRWHDDIGRGTSESRFRVSIPKEIMKLMPPPPNDFATPEFVHEFNIEVQMVDLDDPYLVDVCIDWLLQDYPSTVALVCKYGIGGSLNLIQLSVHQRCVLIRVPCRIAVVPVVPVRLITILSENDIMKIGADIQKDALALFHFLGVAPNNCVRISQYFFGQKRRKGLLSLFRELFQWDWKENKKIICSDWGAREISLEQIKYAVLDAWTSRLVWTGQTEMWKIETPSFSLADLPWPLLHYFGRSVFSFETRNRKDQGTAVEVKGAVVEVHRGYLSLKQKNFKSRVMGQKSIVELRFKDGRKAQKYLTLFREGNRVVLDNVEPSSTVKGVQELEEDIAMISKVYVDNSNNSDVQKQKLEDSLYVLLCIPGACPRHILVALGFLHNESMIPPRQFSLEDTFVQDCKVGLNASQSDAWQQMLSSPLSAVIGPPGTGKTTVISAVAKAWTRLAGGGETLVCAAHQNVAVRHLAETMLKEKLAGVLLLVSEDYYVGWHEDEYAQDVKEISVVSGSLTTSAMQSWTARNGNEPPRILLCTLALIGCESFNQCLMGSKVSSMIIDECSQAAEGSLIPTLGCLPHLQMLSVVGDPCQLPPFGLKETRSVFDLLSRSCNVKLLQEQYRMPYRIAQFVSAEFYGGRLHTDERKRWKDSDKALLWVNVKGRVDTVSGGTSLCNQAEAEAVDRKSVV